MIRQIVTDAVLDIVRQAEADGLLPGPVSGLVVQQPADPKHGDWSTNVALAAAKAAGRPPRDLARDLSPLLEALSFVARVEIAGPGFLNLFLRETFEAEAFGRFRDWLADGGRLEPEGGREKILVEFVSANPTGPLHVGHGRGAAVGDSVVRLLRRAGHEVTAEYYVNDAGRQMEVLGLSLCVRVRQALGEDIPFPDDAYRGDYVIAMARDFLALHRESWADWDENERLQQCRRYATRAMLELIRDDLARFRVSFDHWRSEQGLYDSGEVDQAIAELREGGHLETRDGALWFRSSLLGDEKDRVVVRAEGVPTYLAADIAYHREKFRRGFDRAIDFWGADHHGYEPRVRAAMRALGQPDEGLEVRFIQFVSLLRDGETVSMSTRAGTFETLEDVVRDVGIDAARFFYLLRRPESHLEFDLDLARRQANENPVYYVQYAHARVCSLHRQAAERQVDTERAFEPAALADPADRDLLKVLLRWPELLESAAAERAPHQVVFYLQDLAAAFHGYYNKQRILDAPDPDVAAARLALADAVGRVLRDGLAVIGVEAPEQM